MRTPSVFVLLLVAMVGAAGARALTARPSLAPQSTTGLVVFAAATNDGHCHRDLSTGCDIYLGDINLSTGVIANAVLVNDGINGSSTAQWFPAISPDGKWIAYSETPSNRVVLVRLAGLSAQTISNAKFPAFSADSRRLYYSTTGTTTIWSVEIGATPLPASTQVTTTVGTDPFPIGSGASESYVAFHVEEPPTGIAVSYIRTMPGGPETRMPCMRSGAPSATACGHVSVSASMTRIGATGPGSTTFWISTLSGSTWSAFAPTLDSVGAAILAKDSRFNTGVTFLGNAAWPTDTTLVSTAEAATGTSGNYTTTLSRLFVVDLTTSAFTAVTVSGYDPAHMQTGQASIALSTNVQTQVLAFTDPTLTVGTTLIKAVHVTELRSAIDTLRARHGLAAYAWTDSAAAAGTTTINAAHIAEMRTALQAAYAAAGSTAPAFTNPTLTAGASTVAATHITELRAAVIAIW
jgi:hypothetical protein